MATPASSVSTQSTTAESPQPSPTKTLTPTSTAAPNVNNINDNNDNITGSTDKTNSNNNGNNNNNNNNNNNSDNNNQWLNSALAGTTCLELALEGERLCKIGDLENGIRFFEEAAKVGPRQDRTLSAIYSQLGNGYFYMQDFQRALEYHKKDVKLTHEIGDQIAEAKACGNLGNTLKMLGKFDEAIAYCRRYLELCRRNKDCVGEGRALYNLGNVFHTQAKHMIGANEQEPGGVLSSDIKSTLQEAIKYYELNLKVVTELKDYSGMGRAYGNLGNTYYLLGSFELAVDSHKNRLELARQTNDKAAERRAHFNLGNANIFLGNFQEAVENYSSTLKIAQEIHDKYTEANACYSLANTYTFLRNYKSAVSYHLKYLDMIKEFEDKLGEGRACWSLVNMFQMLNEPETALIYAKRHYEIAELLGDKAGLTSAKLNIDELEEIITQKHAAQMAYSGGGGGSSGQLHQLPDTTITSKKHSPNNRHVYRLSLEKRQEQEQRRFKKQLSSTLANDIDGLATRRKSGKSGLVVDASSERLFDTIEQMQSSRIDDQRCEFIKKPSSRSRNVDNNKENFNRAHEASSTSSSSEILGGAGYNARSHSSLANQAGVMSTAASVIKATYRKASLVAYPTANLAMKRRPTVAEERREQFFDLIAGAQSRRMDEQRASLPALALANGILKNPRMANLLNRGHTMDQASTSGTSTNPALGGQTRRLTNADTIIESHQLQQCHPTERSHSIVPTAYISADSEINTSPSHTETALNPNPGASATSKLRLQKLNRRFKTIDSDPQVHDDKFLDSLMRYQSNRFDDQRAEFPRKTSINLPTAQVEDRTTKESGVEPKNQTDSFFNLIVRFQSNRINDQRSEPPPSKDRDI